MNHNTMLIVAIWFTGMCALTAAGFLGWLVWQIGCDAYDHVMGKWKRIHNRRIDAAYTTGQFAIPRQMRDWK